MKYKGRAEAIAWINTVLPAWDKALGLHPATLLATFDWSSLQAWRRDRGIQRDCETPTFRFTSMLIFFFLLLTL